MLLNLKSDRSSSKLINDVSFNFMNKNDNNGKKTDKVFFNGFDDTKSNISGNLNENAKKLKAKEIIDEDSELIMNQMLVMLNEYNNSIKYA